MLPGRRSPEPPDDEPLLRRAKQLAIEAHRVGAAAAADTPNRAELLASLAADLDDVYRAMAVERDALKEQLDAAVRQKTAVAAYDRIAQTLTTNRKRT